MSCSALTTALKVSCQISLGRNQSQNEAVVATALSTSTISVSFDKFLLSPYSSTLATGGFGKLVVSGFINSEEDNEAAEKEIEQMAPGSSPRLTHHPKMGATSYIPPRVFEPPSGSKPGPAGPIAFNAPAVNSAKLQATCSNSSSKTADRSRGRMSPFAAGVAGEPGKFTCVATKGEGEDNKSLQAVSYLPVRKELPCDSESIFLTLRE